MQRPGKLNSRLGARVCSVAGRFLMEVEQPRRAQRWFERAARLDPADPTALHGLGVSLLRGGDRGPVRAPGVGLVLGDVGDPVSARAVFVRALELQPRHEGAIAGLADALIGSGDLDAADEALARTTSSSRTIVQARVGLLVARGRMRGALLRSEASALTEHYRTLLADQPDDSTRHKLVRHLVQIGHFDEAGEVAWPDAPDDATSWTIDQLVDATPHPSFDWLFVEHARLLALGRARDSHEVKLRLAQRPSPPLNRRSPLSHLFVAVQQDAYANGPESALQLLGRHSLAFAADDEKLALRKLEADLRLSCGDAAPLRRLRTQWLAHHPPAEALFADTVSGANVLVIGPSLSTQPTATEVTAADVIVTTKRPHPLARAGQCQIAYLNDASAQLDAGGIAGLLDATADEVRAVVRPSMLTFAPTRVPIDSRVRVMPCEDSNALLGTRFGIQRILYDLATYDVGSITLTGVDFFLSPTPYRQGYDNEVAEIYDPQGLQPAGSVAPHDYLADYVFTRTLERAGLISGSALVTPLLGFTNDEYLRRLEAHLRPSIPTGKHPAR